jgi:hypothetical protein
MLMYPSRNELALASGATVTDPKRYAATLRQVLERAKVDGYVRPFHDGRHTSITNAATLMAPVVLMAPAGYSDFKTAGHIELAGQR